MTEWQPIETAPRREMLLLKTKVGGLYVGTYRTGVTGEPQSNEIGWRATCCGRFTNPVAWKRVE